MFEVMRIEKETAEFMADVASLPKKMVPFHQTL